MGDKKIKYYSLRIDEDLLLRFKHVAKEDRRSVNRELIFLICENIAEFEAEHGEIPLPEAPASE